MSIWVIEERRGKKWTFLSAGTNRHALEQDIIGLKRGFGGK